MTAVTLAQFLLDRLRDDEAAARAAEPGPCPTRVLREIRAKRALVRKYRSAVRRKRAEWLDYADWVDGRRPRTRAARNGADPALIPGLELAIRIVAAAYSRHPDYQKEWRP